VAGEAVLIAALSGRALAQAARRARYVPLVADAFGDVDMQAATHDCRVIDRALERGFRAKPLIAALDELVAAAPTQPIGLVLGSGFEDKPRLWEVLDRRYGVLGCNAETVRACKDPRIFFGVLDQLGIAHPETRMTPPDNPEGWLSKRIGGSGGRHVRNCTSASRQGARRYFQRRIMDGQRISVSAVIARDGIGMALSRQWRAPSEAQPYRYGGAVSLPDGSIDVSPRMLISIDQLARGLDLTGVVSFDFVVGGATAYLLEVNPRHGATLDVFDDAQGTLFHAHMTACKGEPLERRGGDALASKAAAVLHADRGLLTLGDFDWPTWVADRGAPGTYIPLGAPIATVFAEAETPDAAEALARARLAELESLIYEASKS
jgi:uncharacterized protein